VTLLLRGGVVLAGSFAPADVLLDGERIAAVAPRLEPPHGARVVDLAGDLVIPGLVNAHYHSPDNLNTALTPLAPLELWSLASVPLRERSPDELRLAALFGAAQLLRGGVTSVIDMIRVEPATVDALDAVAGAYADAGMRAAIAAVVADLPLERTLPLGPWEAPAPDRPAAEARLAPIAELHRRWHGRDGRLAVQIAPSAPHRCSDELLEASFALARGLGTMVHTHALETRAQAEQARLRWGRPLLPHLAAAGMLGPSTALAHVVWPEASDVALLAERRAVVVHDPSSNLALGSGIAPVPAMLAAGVRLALGTDAATCNDGLSMFEAMKLAATLHRPGEPDWRRWPSAEDGLRLATRGGAAALGREAALGTVAAGQLADLAVLRAADAAFVPPNDLVRQLVMRAGPGAVRHVFVGGRQVVADGELLTVDLDAVLGEVRSIDKRTPRVAPAELEGRIAAMLASLRAR
jgi:5-methylthioadenosine/S-adenosylhomocysteine deaminase